MKNRLISSLITVLTLSGLQAQSAPPIPRLVVALTIDQLRTDYIEAFAPLYTEKGFKRLWKEGKIYLNAEYTYSAPDRSSAIAALYTGTTPSVNGIIGNERLDISTLRVISPVEDTAFMGYYTTESSSPNQLLVSTVSDELKVATIGRAKVYSVAPQRDAAILSAGHAADGAFWINDVTGKWAGSTFYGEFPLWLTRYNDQEAADTRIDNLEWLPLLSKYTYNNLPHERFNDTFTHKIGENRLKGFRNLINSPFVNDEVNRLTEEIMRNCGIGIDDTPDYLALTYYAGNYNHASIQNGSIEIQDTYARLDRSIADLLEIIEKRIGLQHVVFFVTSTGYTDTEGADPGRFQIPGGEFHINRCTALLNLFLMATYGEGQYIEAHHGLHIYLNRKLIEDKQLNLADVQAKAAEFLVQFSGVNDVFTANRLLLGAWSPESQKRKNAYHRKLSGDLVISLMPGWTQVKEQSTTDVVARYAYIPSPAIFMGGGIKPEIIHTPITVDHIAPTLTHILRIRAPNGCTATPLTSVR